MPEIDDTVIADANRYRYLRSTGFILEQTRELQFDTFIVETRQYKGDSGNIPFNDRVDRAIDARMKGV